jgi:ubiquinone/menaquinone biosynthesis C-methylase UbiE
MPDELDTALRLYYHEIAAEYDNYWTRRGKFFEPASNAVFHAQVHELGREVTRFAASLPHSDSVRVVDLACGTGWWTPYLARTIPDNGRVVTLDWSPAMLEVARERLQELELQDKVSYVQADAYNLPFAGNSFDGVLMGFWLGHVQTQRLPGFLQELKRILKPGGLILALEHAPSPGRPDEEVQNREFKNGHVRPVLKRRYSIEALRGVLEQIAQSGRASARITTRDLFVMGWAQV